MMTEVTFWTPVRNLAHTVWLDLWISSKEVAHGFADGLALLVWLLRLLSRVRRQSHGCQPKLNRSERMRDWGTLRSLK